jgi:hypothetical protein
VFIVSIENVGLFLHRVGGVVNTGNRFNRGWSLRVEVTMLPAVFSAAAPFLRVKKGFFWRNKHSPSKTNVKSFRDSPKLVLSGILSWGATIATVTNLEAGLANIIHTNWTEGKELQVRS